MIKQKKIILIILSIFFLALISFLIILFTIIIPERKEKEHFEEQVKLYYENKLKIYEEENERFEDYEIDVAFIGDSLTDAYDLEKYLERDINIKYKSKTYNSKRRITISSPFWLMLIKETQLR